MLIWAEATVTAPCPGLADHRLIAGNRGLITRGVRLSAGLARAMLVAPGIGEEHLHGHAERN